jgi:hypothetical protein
MVLPCGWWRRGWRRAGGARMVGSAGEAILGTMPFHRWSVGRGRELQGGCGGFPELRPSIDRERGREATRGPTCESGLLRLGEDRGINGARARGCRRQNHGAQVVNVYTTLL